MADRPTTGELAHQYKAAKTEYFFHLKKAKIEANRKKYTKMANEFQDSSKESRAWSALRYSDKMASTSPIIEKAIGPREINEFWFKNYEKAYTDEPVDFSSKSK